MPCEWHPVFTGCFSFSELIGGKEDWREYAGQICSRRGESEHQQFRSRNDYEKYACADSEVNSWPDCPSGKLKIQKFLNTQYNSSVPLSSQ